MYTEVKLREFVHLGVLMMKTDFETLKALSSYTIDVLVQDGLIDYDSSMREDLIEAMATEYSVSLATDEDIIQQAIEEVEDKMGVDNIPEDITESEMFNHARKEIIKSFSGENIAGIYLVDSLFQVAKRIASFLMECEFVEDVFATDDDLISFLVKRIKGFTVKKN